MKYLAIINSLMIPRIRVCNTVSQIIKNANIKLIRIDFKT